MTRTTVFAFLAFAATCQAQFFAGGKDPRWQTVGVGALAARPATCTGGKHVYLCTGSGCSTDAAIHYCTADNTWTVQKGIAPPVMTGDSGSGGADGLVPAPAAGDAALQKFLRADATWTVPSVDIDGLPITPISVQIIPIPDPLSASYSNSGGSGDRQTIISVSTSPTPALDATLSIDGNENSSGRWTPGDVADRWNLYDFGSPRLLTELQILSQYCNEISMGTWKIQASNTATTWTDRSDTFEVVAPPGISMITATQTLTQYTTPHAFA
jgi:hypothetical protein